MNYAAQERNKQRTGFFSYHWGVPKEIYMRKHLPGNTELAVLEFGPRIPRFTWRYATNGMSEYSQFINDGEKPVRTELYGSSKKNSAWIIDLLEALARYPIDYETHFALYDTIQVGQAIDRDTSAFRAILLAPPEPTDPETIGWIPGVFDGLIGVLKVVGIYENECEFAIDHGGRSLFDKLLKAGVSLDLDLFRPPLK